MSYNPNNPNGQATMANSAPVVLASNQSSIPVTLADGADGATGSKADAAATTDTGVFSEIALHKRELVQMVKAVDVDNAPLTNTKPGIVGGKAIDVTAPTAFTTGDAVIDVHDSATGAKVVLQGDLDARYDAVAISEKFAAPAVTITRPANTTVYTANDVIGTPQSFNTVSSGTGNGRDGGFYITGIVVATNDSGFSGKNLKLILYDGNTSLAFTDNSGFSEDTSTIPLMIDQIDIPLVNCIGVTTASKYFNNNLRIPYKPITSATSLIGLLITKDELTPSANSTTIYIKLIVTKNS